VTAAELIAHWQERINHGMPSTVVVTAFDPETEEVIPVTGFLYDAATIEICTEDNT
jgi:hypothetical protein